MVSAKRLKKGPDSASRTVGDEGGLVVLPGRAEVKVLNPVAILIYDMLDGEHSEDQIVEKICEEFEVDEQHAREDLGKFLGELEAEGMLAETGDRSPEESSA